MTAMPASLKRRYNLFLYRIRQNPSLPPDRRSFLKQSFKKF